MLRATNRPILAFFDAIKNLRLRQVSLILKAGYDPNLMVNARGQNGLQYMINFYGATDAHFRLQAPINKAAYLSIAKLLLDSGLDPNAIDLLSGESAIFDAIRFNDKDMVALLLNYVDFALRNKNGETALMCAARFGSKQVMRMLLEHLQHLEMDVFFLRQRNRFGLTPLELARAENIECAKVLAKHLITYDRHPTAVLSRSSSHHQLLAAAARPLPYHLRAAAAAGPSRAPVAATLFDDLTTSDDYEDEVLAPPYLRAAGLGMGAPYRNRTAAAAAAAGFYDPKAAEFNRYLLDQQEDLAAEQMAGGGGGGGSSGLAGQATSDEEEFMAGGSSAGGAGRLVRSRSCMLGPGTQGSKGYAKQGKKSESGASKMGASGGAGASWADNGGASGV